MKGACQSYINPTTGRFLYGTLHIKRGIDPEQENTMIAHEYLHHVWLTVLDKQTKETINSHLITMYSDDVYMKQRVKQYSDAGKLYPTELFSYYCTESSDAYLTTFVRDQCNTYIDRS